MRTRTKAALAGTAGLLGLWLAWGAYTTRTTERVPYDTLSRLDGVEFRRYPRTVLAETTAPDDGASFQRLFRYISGANETSEAVAMTAPVATRGEKIPMTAPVRTLRAGRESIPMTASIRTGQARTTGDGDGAVTMAFYLPSDYTPETAPTPTDPAVRLVVEPARTVAVRRFSWFPTESRVARERRHLLDVLDDRGIAVVGDPSLLGYDPPWTPPFMRTNEVAVTVEAESVSGG